MSLRHELICKIVDETGTVQHMRQDNKLASKTVFEIYEQLGLGEADWSYDKTREDYLKEITKEIGHDERKAMINYSTPLSTEGLQAILDALQESPEKQVQQSSQPPLKPPNMLQRLCS